MEQDKIKTIATINKMTTWLNWLIGFVSCAVLLMIIGGIAFVKTYSSGTMKETARAINNMGVSFFLLGLGIFVILFTIYMTIAIIRLRIINKAIKTKTLGNYKKVSKLWVMIPILVIGFPAWVLLFSLI